MDVIKTNIGVSVRIFYNWLDCPYRGGCPDSEGCSDSEGCHYKEGCPDSKEREDAMIKRRGIKPRCSSNPGIRGCETYKIFEKCLGKKSLGINLKKVHNLDCL